MRVTKDDRTSTLDEEEIKKLLKEKESRVNRAKGAILSGGEAYKAYNIARNKEFLKIEIDEQNSVKCYISLDDEKPHFMAIFRGGMAISSHKSVILKNKLESLPNVSKRKNFSVLIALEQGDCPDFYRLMKGIEDPHHKELNIRNADEADSKKIKEYCDILYEGITKHVPEIETKDFPLPVLELPLSIMSEKKIRPLRSKRPGHYGSNSKKKKKHLERRKSQSLPRPGLQDFPGEMNYRINKDNNQILLRIKLKEADDKKRLSLVLREDSGYDNDPNNDRERLKNSKILGIKGYRLEKNTKLIKENNEDGKKLIYVDCPLEKGVEYMLTAFFQTNAQPILEPSVAYTKPPEST